MQLIKHPNADALTDQVRDQLTGICREALAGRRPVFLALAGGSTPLPVYRQFANEDLDWASIHLIPGDDRWVGIDDPASNRRALSECFAATSASVLPLVPDDPGAEPDLETARLTLNLIEGAFDACVLGMGADGHFASLFPGDEGLAAALDPEDPDEAVAIRPDPLPPEAPYARISLTLRRLLDSRHRLLLIRGDRKLDVLERAIAGADLPVTALIKQAGPRLDIHWSP